ncbi:tight junction-associated protein 1-like isoform X2 [Penaeus japonicus]|uniref:tight junction-associated protein 1-like isoform X2 n=1 Tax=Penaeus japonicus TaxID=27405 RepID=UPI001C70DE87|nr:tight junction-associated protein 1-like isoform X2 [Penaeus japonicus]
MNSGHGHQGGDCVNCGVSTSALRSEVEVLKRRLLDRDVAIVQLETQMAQDRPDHFPQGQVAVLRAQCDHWQDKYDRLLEAHKRLQKVNQGLEDKLLRLVDRTESEKSSLAADTASLTTALTTAAQAINRLKQENDRYKNDLNLAIQLLQCNPSKYAAHKLDSLPSDLQKKAKSRLAKEPRDAPKPEMKVIKVPIPTFPPTAMVYSVNKYAEENEKEQEVDSVSAAIMAAVLEERQRERARRHCSSCTCGSLKTDSGESILGENSHLVDLQEINGNGNGSILPEEGSDREDIKKNRLTGFKVSVVDVGTQMFPSYIGETGKVQSTCIYCQSSKNVSQEKLSTLEHTVGKSKAMSLVQHSRSRSQPVNQVNSPSEEENSPRTIHPSSPDSVLKSPTFRTHSRSAWDWAAEGHDSGTPSTPSSLISASLSYESETSNVSPQDSPGRLSLVPLRSQHGKPVNQSSDIHKASKQNDNGNNTPQMLKQQGMKEFEAGISPYHSSSINTPPNVSSSTTQSSSLMTQSSSLGNYAYVSRRASSQYLGHTPSPTLINQSSLGSKPNPCYTPSSPVTYKVPFNARSPHQDVFTPPIHRSPPHPRVPRENSIHRDSSTDVVASSTTTASSTETTL